MRKKHLFKVAFTNQMDETAAAADLEAGRGPGSDFLGWLDLPRAMDCWRRIQEVDPTQLESRDEMRRLSKKERMWASLLAALERQMTSASPFDCTRPTTRFP